MASHVDLIEALGSYAGANAIDDSDLIDLATAVLDELLRRADEGEHVDLVSVAQHPLVGLMVEDPNFRAVALLAERARRRAVAP